MASLKKFLLLSPLLLLLSSCDYNSIARFGWPEAATKEADASLSFWQGAVITALLVGALVWGLTFWCIVAYRKRKNSPEFPRQTGYNVPLELVYTFAPFVIISVLFFFTYTTQNKVLANERPQMVVDVTGFQWNWKFGYRYIQDGPNGKEYGFKDHGTADSPFSTSLDEAKKNKSVSGDELKIRGIDPKDAYYLVHNNVEIVGTRDKIPVLVLPVDTRINFVLASKDVVHSFWVPAFLEKRDVVPFPKENHVNNVLQISGIKHEGAYVGHCAEMCGQYHSMMNFEIRAVTKDKFEKYISARLAGKNDAQALKLIGESPVALTSEPLDIRIPNSN